jgi:hypothetical protein
VAPDAKAVALTGNFTGEPIPATRHGDRWVVEIPMSEGEYVWGWQIDQTTFWLNSSNAGDSTKTGVRMVRPLERVTGAYPKPR